MPAYPRPVRVSPDDDPIVVQYDPDMDLWCGTDGSRRNQREVEGWASYAPVSTAAAILTATLNEWTAHWPPRTGNDIDETVYGPLTELSADKLEKLAHAASELSRKAWEARAVKMTEEARVAQGITWATVTVASDGKLLPDSVVTVDETSVPVPERSTTGGILAANRLSAALRSIGYKAVNLRDTVLDGERLSFLVRKVPAGE
jgi:hypothetical protein